MKTHYVALITEENISSLTHFLRLHSDEYCGYRESWNLHIDAWFYYPQFSEGMHSSGSKYDSTKKAKIVEITAEELFKITSKEDNYQIF